jgi:ankyrin repeat protein
VICAFLSNEHETTLTLTKILANLIGQLLSQKHAIPDALLDFYPYCGSSETVPTLAVMIDLVHSVMSSTHKVYLVLDDSTPDNGLLASLLDTFSKAANLSVLVSSSRPPFCFQCERNVDTFWRCKICLNGRFELCPDCRMLGRGCYNDDHRLIEFQKDQITINIDALCSLDHRKRILSRAMDSTIAEVQRRNPDDDHLQSPLIDEAFERIMSQTIKESGHEDLAMAAFDVVRHAFSPLREHQFKTAVRHVLRRRRPHPITYPTITDVIEATGGLLIVQQDSVITWFHSSLSGYFERSHARWFPSGHSSMAWACLTVLMSQAIPTDAGGTGNWATGSLYGYAACSWGRHLRACSPDPVLEDLAMRYLDDDEKLKLGTLTAYALQPEDIADGFDAGDGLAAVHVCSIFGLTNLLQDLPIAGLSRQTSSTGRTPLDYACSMGHLDTVQVLLDSNAVSHSESADGLYANTGVGTALGLASIYGHSKVVQLLLERGADVNARNSTTKNLGETPLISASRGGHAGIVQMLLDHGADPHLGNPRGPIDLDDTRGGTPLAYACRLGHVEVVKLLLRAGADPMLGFDPGSSDTPEIGLTVLHEAIKSRRLPVVKTLLRLPSVKLTPITSREDEIVSLLTSLIELRSLDILRLALARDDLDINEKDHNGRTALWWLLRVGEYDPAFQLNAMQLVVRHPKCDINVVDLGGRTYVMRFLNVRMHDTKLLSLLLENGADVNYMDEDGETAIFHAVTIRYSVQITSSLIRHGADLARKNQWGQGLSHRLVADMEDWEDLQYLDLLLEHMPALIDAQDDRGRTPLHLALVFGKIDIAEELLARGADVNSLDKFGRAPFDIACQYGRTAILPRLAPVGLYAFLEAEQPRIVSPTRQSVPIRFHRLDRSSPLPPRGLRRAKSEHDFHANAKQEDAAVSDPWEINQYPLAPMNEGYDRLASKALNSIFQPPKIVREANSQRDRHGTYTNSLAAGEAMLEMHLSKLPGWSLGYLGKCGPVDSGSSTDTCRTV